MAGGLDGGLRAPLRVLAGALALTALLVVLQTIVLRALPYDGGSVAYAAMFFRIAFMVADAACLVSLVRLGRREPAIYPFALLGATTLALTLFFGLLGLAVRSSMAGFAGLLAALDPMMSFGTAILVALALASAVPPTAAVDPRRRTAFIVAFAAALVVMMMRLVPAFIGGLSSVALSWARWAVAVVQPAALAAIAFLLAREASSTKASGAGAAAGAGAYRAASEGGSPTVARPELAAPSPATIAPMKTAEGGIAIHRIAFIVRILAVLCFTILGIGAVGAGAFVMIALVGAATAIVILVGIVKQRALHTFEGGKSATTALVFFGLSAAADLSAALWTMANFGWRMKGPGLVAYPMATFFAVLGIIFVSRAHQRAGDLLFKYRLAGRARWTQGLVVVAVTLGLALLAAVSHLDRRSSYEAVGPFFAVALVLGMLGTAIAFVVMHVLTLNEAAAVLRARLSMAQSPKGDPPS